MALNDWGSMVAVVVEEQRGREGFWQCLGLPFSPRCQVHRTNEKRVFEDPWTQREIPSRSFPPLGRFAKEIREREKRLAKARVT
jgi:hypothetical protein